MERECDLPVDGHLVGRRTLCRRDPVVGDAVGARLRLYCRVVRIEKKLKLRFVEILFVFDGRGALDSISIVKHDTQIADAADAGFRADGWLTGLEARIAED